MKKLSNLLAALVFGSLVIFMSCGGGGDTPAPTAAELQAALLTGGTWSAATTDVTYDGGPSDADWTGFTLTLTGDAANGGTYSTGSTTPAEFEDVWPASGGWSFANDAGTSILRTGGNAGDVTMTVSAITETSLTLTFTVADPSARVSGIYDEPWSFTFTK